MLHFLKQFLNKESNSLSQSIKNITGFTPGNISIYHAAFTHRSVAKESRSEFPKNNERLEFLGDAVVDLIVADILFRKYPTKDEGFLTQMRSKIVNAKYHAILANKLGLDKFLKTNKSLQSVGMNHNIYGDLFESFVGAIYLDKGYNATFKFVKDRVFSLYVDFSELEKSELSFKSKLLEWAQKNGHSIEFRVIGTPESSESKKFNIELFVNGESMAQGFDFTKKQAEQNAAEKYLQKR